MHLLYPFAKRFIAGGDLATALPAIKNLQAAGFQTTVDILGEHIHSPAQAELAKNEYQNLFAAARRENFSSCDFSIKLSQMGQDIDNALCRRNMLEILAAARDFSVRLDMEGSATTESTVNACLELQDAHPHTGVALQAYLYRTRRDVERMIERKVSVRLCKGAYKEKADVAYQSMREIRRNFYELACLLLKRGRMPAIATHDERLLLPLMDFVEKEKIDRKAFHFEMLYGVRRDLHREILRKNYQMRIYVPYGKHWLPYTLRRLGERKENIFFVVSSLLKEAFGGKLSS